MNFELTPTSDNIQDRRDWTLLGYDVNGNAYSEDSSGALYRQDWSSTRGPDWDPGHENEPPVMHSYAGWKDAEQVDEHPDLIQKEFVPTGDDGKPVWLPSEKDQFGKCNTCKGGKAKKPKPKPWWKLW